MTALFIASVAAFVCAALYLAARLLSVRLALGAVVAATVGASFAQTSLVATDLCVFFASLFIGILIGQTILSRVALGALVSAAAAADLTSFFAGPTRTLLTGNARVLRYLAICVEMHGHVYAVIGLGDLILFTACCVGMRRCRYSDWAAFLVPLSGILGALAFALAVGPLPALPFLALVVLAYQFISRGCDKEKTGASQLQ